MSETSDKLTFSENSILTRLLSRAHPSVFVFFAVFASFSTYFCMYAFRKPFAAATFEGEHFMSSAVELKTAIVISQILGYAFSKYLGIKFCSEITPQRRAFMLVALIVIAEISLVLYGLVPGNLKVVAIFFNGLPLGMVWGLVVWYLEGRRTSELLLAGLSCSFIVSSGIVKDFGRAMLGGDVALWWNSVPLIGGIVASRLGEVSEGWMPAIVGLHFLPLFLCAVWMLNQLPGPSSDDILARQKRVTMDGASRLNFVREFFGALFLLIVAYLFLTAYRDFRDNYQVEILEGLGYPYAENKAIISKAETLVAFGVVACLALLNLIKDNRWGLIGAYGVMTAGVLLLGGATLGFEMGYISGFWWITLTGLGSYLAYVPYGSVLFDRLIASTKVAGTAVFAIYLADAIGYTGSVGVQLYKDLAHADLSRLAFFKSYTWFMAFLGVGCMLVSLVLVLRKIDRLNAKRASS
ncbi:DUF5690 family protein [bacterium]|jgi:hypothetical protein|nr:DUF5690 family protein [bacterium]